VRTHREAHVVQALHENKARWLTAYILHGMSGETKTFLHRLPPLNLPIYPKRLRSKLFVEIQAWNASDERENQAMT